MRVWSKPPPIYRFVIIPFREYLWYPLKYVWYSFWESDAD